jgi:hypothetical protein
MSDGYVTDFMTGKLVRGFIPDPSAPGKYLCNFGECRQPTGHRNYAVCWKHTAEPFREHRVATEHAERYDREFMAAMKICDPPSVLSSRVSIEIVMQGATVRKARELRASRKRKPLMSDERRGHGVGEIDLGEIS